MFCPFFFGELTGISPWNYCRLEGFSWNIIVENCPILPNLAAETFALLIWAVSGVAVRTQDHPSSMVSPRPYDVFPGNLGPSPPLRSSKFAVRLWWFWIKKPLPSLLLVFSNNISTYPQKNPVMIELLKILRSSTVFHQLMASPGKATRSGHTQYPRFSLVHIRISWLDLHFYWYIFIVPFPILNTSQKSLVECMAQFMGVSFTLEGWDYIYGTWKKWHAHTLQYKILHIKTSLVKLWKWKSHHSGPL